MIPPIVGGLLLFAAGCATGPRTELSVGGAQEPAVWEFRDVYWRPAAGVEGGVEVIGYGFVGFYNDPISRNYDARWPTSGRVVVRLHGISQPMGKFAFTLLGPSMTLGPGDDELIQGEAQNVTIESGEKQTRAITIPTTAVTSRNRPGMALNLSGTIHARPTDDRSFERQLRQFSTERGYRDLPHVTQPQAR